MRRRRTFVDWLPTLLASTTVFAKLMAMATMWTSSPIAHALFAFVLADVIPFTVANAARARVFDTRGTGPFLAQMLVWNVVLLTLTAVQWYVVGALVRRWLFSRESRAVPVRFR